MDFIEIANTQMDKDVLSVNSTEWNNNWEEYYVIFADLIAFAQRCMISPGITLNNIVRFHRAINESINGIDDIIKYQFTDASYILAKDPKTALIVATNIQNECLLHNYKQMRLPHVMFYQMIVPKVVISKGNVLTLKTLSDITSIKKIAGISPKELLAGEGIVKAYYLEKKTTGGLVSVDKNYIQDFKKPSSGDNKTKTNGLYKKWRNDLENKLLSHDGVIDIPWLVLQPRQIKKGTLQTETVGAFKEKAKAFNHIWRTSFTEHLAERTSTETLKQYGGGISHLCEVIQAYKNVGPRSWDLIDVVAAIESL